MTPNRWPTLLMMPISWIAAAGIAQAGPAEGPVCRQFVPSAGVTIAVDCAPPAAAVVKASVPVAAPTCRRFVPRAQMSIEEPCPEPAAADTVKDGKPTGAPAKTGTEPAPAGERGKSSSAAPAAAPAKAASLAAARDVAPGGCSGIIERAQLGGETEHDLATLRTRCARGG